MISDFESRLAEVLGSRMPAPFGGRASVAPPAAQGADPQVVVGVRQVVVAEPDIGSRRLEVVPASAEPRRILRLDCTVGIQVVPAKDKGRSQQLLGVDAALYTVDAPDFRDGSALNDGTDRGFLLNSMSPLSADSPLDPAAPNMPALGLTLLARGLFWPAGVAGEAGKKIGEIRIRGSILPVELGPARPDLIAGGPTTTLTIRVRAAGTMRVNGGAAPPLPFGSLAVVLFGSGGRPGNGTLSGGTAGVGAVRLFPVTDGVASVSYTPPAIAGTDELVVSLDNGAGDVGIEIGRVRLVVRRP